MKIQLRTAPVPEHLQGRKRFVRRVKTFLRGTLVVGFGRDNRGLAN